MQVSKLIHVSKWSPSSLMSLKNISELRYGMWHQGSGALITCKYHWKCFYIENYIEKYHAIIDFRVAITHSSAVEECTSKEFDKSLFLLLYIHIFASKVYMIYMTVIIILSNTTWRMTINGVKCTTYLNIFTWFFVLYLLQLHYWVFVVSCESLTVFFRTAFFGIEAC